jgi:hypothetical protein
MDDQRAGLRFVRRESGLRSCWWSRFPYYLFRVYDFPYLFSFRVTVHDLSEAMSMVKRYFTSDLSIRS